MAENVDALVAAARSRIGAMKIAPCAGLASSRAAAEEMERAIDALVDSLGARLGIDERDARRYRWLRDRPVDSHITDLVFIGQAGRGATGSPAVLSGEDADRIVDAAIKEDAIRETRVSNTAPADPPSDEAARSAT